MLFVWIIDFNVWLVLGILMLLEIVFGIDNIIFFFLVVVKFFIVQCVYVCWIGLMGVMVMCLVLLVLIVWVVKLINLFFIVFGQEILFCDLILLFGGLFFIWKVSKEIYEFIEGEEEGLKINVYFFFGVIVQIMLLDIIFSFDLVIIVVGLLDYLFIMMVVVVIVVGVMMFVV